MHSHVYCGTITIAQINQPNVNQEVNGKETVVLKHSGIQFLLQKDEMVAIATTWMNLEDTLLCEISHVPKKKYFMISFTLHMECKKS